MKTNFVTISAGDIHNKQHFICFDTPEKTVFADSTGASVTYSQLASMLSKFLSHVGSLGWAVAEESVLIATGRKTLDAILAVCCIHVGLRFTIVDKQKDASHHEYVCEHSDAAAVFISKSSGASTEWISERVKCVFEVELADSVLNITGSEGHTGTIKPSLTQDDLFPQAIFYTSGSTGQPKGIVVSRQQLLDGAECVTTYLGLKKNDVILSYLPISFDYGFNQILCALKMGSTVILEDDFVPLKFKSICTQFRPSVLPGSPSIFLNLGKMIKRRPDLFEFSSIRLITNTGGRVPEVGHRFIQALVDAFATRPFLMYGLTESFRSSFLPPELYGQKHNAIGRAVPGVSLFLLNEAGALIQAPYQIGQIVHSGRLISCGYYKNKTATEALIQPLRHPQFDGIFNPPLCVKSGDLGYFDEDGIFFYMGRKDNLIKVREQRTSLDQIEDIVSKLDLFDASASVADKDSDGMTIIHIFAVVAAGTRKQTDEIRRRLLAALPKHLAGFRLSLCAELPVNVNGKICRKTLSDQLTLPESQLDYV